MDNALAIAIRQVEENGQFEVSGASLEKRMKSVNEIFSAAEKVALQPVLPVFVDSALEVARKAVVDLLAKYGDIEPAMGFNERYNRLERAYRGTLPTSDTIQ